MSSEADRLLKQIDPTRLPAHVAIIMDGNGRWAKRHHLPRLLGHRAGSKTVREIVEIAGQLGIKVLTLYAFSTENWSRPKAEVDGLMRLLTATLRKEVAHLNRNNVRLGTIGHIAQLPQSVQDELRLAKEKLQHNTGLRLILALNYGGRQDIIQACNAILSKGITSITEQYLTSHLYTGDLPDPDLLIRTSGEYRVSNFLLWQIAYAEIHITPVLWPDFRQKDFYKAIIDYQSRERRFGALN